MIDDELREIAERLDAAAARSKEPAVQDLLRRLELAAETVGKAWSGSWFGYHARVYYRDLQEAPPGARFSQEWGLEVGYHFQKTIGDWVEYASDDVKRTIHDLAGDPDLAPAHDIAQRARATFGDAQAEIASLLSLVVRETNDVIIARISTQINKLVLPSAVDFIKAIRPTSGFMPRDTVAFQAGLHTPPHYAVLAEVATLQQPAQACERLATLARRAATHLGNLERYAERNRTMGTRVFIGHGRSPLWRELKDFVQDRLRLPWDEFNRTPAAGIPTTTRLSEMLDQATFALLVMTAEDEQADGTTRARTNVVHEAGLFQGRLGFSKAIIILEDSCEEFSNIYGLGQIRFPRGKISAAFEDIRHVLEREGIVAS